MQTPATDTMPYFQRVLVATDFSAASESAFRTALDMCARLGASLCIMHVFECAEMAKPDTGGLLLEMQGLREHCQEDLHDMCRQAGHAGVKCETILLEGMAANSILEALEEKEIDLAVLGTNALHGFERLVFGSTAETVLRTATCPVLTVGPRVAGCPRSDESHADGPIVFATDFDFTTMHAIRYAACFANLIAAPLHCLHVLPRTLEAGSQSEIVPAIMAEALQQLTTESGVVIEPPTCATTFGSEISYAVVDYARRVNARMIVLGVRQASLLASHVPEHITYRVITEANCPVLTMAFESNSHSRHNALRREDKHLENKDLSM
jgi:nucleotide-binding universal stress UspA family protein